MKTKPSSLLGFFKDLLIVLGVITLIAIVVALVMGHTGQVSNTYFVATVICWIAAAVPAFSEIGGNAKISIQNRKEIKKAREIIRGKEEEYQQGARKMYLYGFSGVICFILAIVTLAIS